MSEHQRRPNQHCQRYTDGQHGDSPGVQQCRSRSATLEPGASTDAVVVGFVSRYIDVAGAAGSRWVCLGGDPDDDL